jgi:hypothetical protein
VSLSLNYYHFYRGGYLTSEPGTKDVDYFSTWMSFTFNETNVGFCTWANELAPKKAKTRIVREWFSSRRDSPILAGHDVPGIMKE